ncbi:MAG: polysaccharide deacetylase family protein [Bacteroidales bacterium]|nr:polysaccharide deacetylase family protein [Bacteroidales bacterium]
MKGLLTFIFCWIMIMNLSSQNLSIQEKLGFGPDAKLLIIHADDAGVSASTNQAVTESFQDNLISSTAIMVPCPWFPEIAEFARLHPEFDFGLHLTFSSEWEGYKWGGVAPSTSIPSLLNEQGYFYATTPEAVKHARPDEVELELRAQIEKALAAGIKPSHFDTHMNTVYGSAALLRVYVKLGNEYGVPVMIQGNIPDFPDSLRIPETENYPLINVYEAPTEVDPENWQEYYLNVIKNLEPGISEIILHLAYDNAETRAMTRRHEYYEAAWRQRDLDVIRSKEFIDVLEAEEIHIIGWGHIQKVMYPD